MNKPLRQDEAPLSSCGIAVMAKASIPGRTKTRLVPPLSFEEAAAFNTVFLQDAAANMLAASTRTAIAGYMAFGPPEAAGFFKTMLPPTIGLIESWLPDFGDCLYETIARLLASGHTSAVVLNSDSPSLPTSLLVETARLLARPGERAVIGPSTDGGYYLLGLKSPHHRLFEDIDWSTERVFHQTIARAAEISLPVHVLPAWYDVDEAETLRQLHAELCEGRGFAPELQSHPAPHTADLFREFVAQDAERWRDILHTPAIEKVE